MNKVMLIGNLANEPEVRTTATGVTCCTFRLATQRHYTDPQTGKREADFHIITAWRKLGELCNQYLAKGSKCAVEGAIQYHSYTGRDGTKRFVTQIVADNVEFLDRVQQDEGQAPAQTGSYTPADDDDEMPF